MKAVLSWTLGAFFALALSTTSFAGDDTSRALLVVKLKQKISKLIDAPALKTVSCKAQTVSIEFGIDEKGNIQVKGTSTENEALEKYILDCLDEQYYHRNLAGGKYIVKVDFKRSS